ncbi:response regulator [Thalassospira sp. MA62]|nr:response regulator [Thalassospira sp. MA62]
MAVKISARVAFVDDDENLLSSHRRNFARLKPDWDALFFNEAGSAFDCISTRTDVGVAVLDINMPGMTGLELAAELRKNRPDLIIVMLTGYADLQSALLAMNELDVFRFYPKPTNLKTILDGVEEELQSRTGYNDMILPTAFLDLFQLGTVAIDATLSILHMNTLAAEIMNQSTILTPGSEKLAITPFPEGLAQFLNPPANQVPRGQQSFLLERDTEKISLFVRRLPKTADDPQTFMLLLVDPTRQRPPAVDDLMDLFGLTRSEAKLTQKLAEGLALEQAAGLVGVSHSTARTYLKTIFAKTGVNRQPQLMRTVFSTIPSLR